MRIAFRKPAADRWQRRVDSGLTVWLRAGETANWCYRPTPARDGPEMAAVQQPFAAYAKLTLMFGDRSQQWHKDRYMSLETYVTPRRRMRRLINE
jgi:hypothetical protein